MNEEIMGILHLSVYIFFETIVGWVERLVLSGLLCYKHCVLKQKITI